jgi:ribosomal protein L7/L12
MQSKNVQTAFSVKITSFDEKNKVALIKEIKKLMPDMNMVQVLNNTFFKYCI